MTFIQNSAVTFKQKKLSNGVPVFHFERKGMPIYARLVFNTGSSTDSIEGISHFVEHMLLAGCIPESFIETFKQA